MVVGTQGDYVDVKRVEDGNARTTDLVSGFKSAVKPEEAKVGNSVCYYDGMKHVFLRLVSSERLESAFGAGECPVNPPAQLDAWER